MRTSKTCQSCLALIDYRQQRRHCRYYCSDDEDQLLPREIPRRHLRYFFQAWQNIPREKAEKRADLYMKAMPAWAED